jgi:predicted RNA-binding protein YlxR (DUF448 family)
MIGSGGHTPERRCIGCRRRGPKESFIRIARLPSGDVVVDSDGRMPGRGAYICRSAECLGKAAKRKAFARALRVDEGHIPYEALRSAVVQGH